MNKRSHGNGTDDFVKAGMSQRRQFLEEDQDVEAFALAQNGARGSWRKEETPLVYQTNPRLRRIGNPVLTQYMELPRLVDEAAEDQRRLDLERERQRNRELEHRIRQIESSAVVEIPVTIEETVRPISPTRSQKWTLLRRVDNKQIRRRLAFVIVMAAIAGIVLGVVLSTGDAPQWNQLGQTLEGDGSDDNFGYDVALSANGTVVAGPGFGDHGLGYLTGYIRVYSYDTSSKSWTRRGQDLNGKAEGDEMGSALALSSDGSVMAAGATRRLSDPSRNGYIQVHAFNSTTSLWEQVGQYLAGTIAGDQFGSSIALSADGKTVAAGGPGRDSGDDGSYKGNQTGYVRVFVLNSTSWVQMGQDLIGKNIGDAFGRSLALSANSTVVAVGADWGHGNRRPDSGLVQVFMYNSNTKSWDQVGQDLAGEASRDYSGFTLDLSEDGTVVVIGAVCNDGENGRNSGYVRVFSYNSTSSRWGQIGQDIDAESDDDQFGVSVALSADGMIVAAGANRNGKENMGHVRVFSYDRRAERWKQVGEDIKGEGEEDVFGVSVDLSQDGTIVAAGSYLNDGNGPDSGHIRVFENPE